MSDKKREMRGGRTKFGKHVSESSKRYLMRQAKDPFVKQAQMAGYRSRAVFKLQQIQDKHKIIKPGQTVVDLGAAPGGWSQLVAEVLKGNGKVIAIDRLPMDEIAGVNVLRGDFNEQEVYDNLLALCPDGVNVVLSDMAPETIGHAGADHLRLMQLAELAADFALQTLRPGGHFVCKLFQGGEEIKFRDDLRQQFEKVFFFKPAASRKDSREIFLLAQKFKG